MKYFFFGLLGVVLCLHGFSQTLVNTDSALIKSECSRGKTAWGIGVGKRNALCNDLRVLVFSPSDEVSTEYTTNGIQLSVLNDANSLGTTNGVNSGIIFFDEYKVNGLALSPIGYALGKMNGFAFSGISMNVDKQNGIAFSGLFQFSKHINGVSFAGLDIASKNINGVAFAGLACLADSVMNGVELSPIFSRARIANGIIIGLITKTDKTRGIQLGLINRAITMQGVQIGLVNYIRQNPVWCRTLPFINLRFKKDKSEMADK